MAKGGIRESASFDTKAEAVAWATKVEAEIDQGKRRSYAKIAKTLSDAFDKYERDISPDLGGHGWNVTRLKFLRGELSFIGEQIRKIKPEMIEAWRDKRLKLVKTSTVNRDLNLISAVFEAARTEWKWMPINPVHEVKRPKNPDNRTRRVSDDEMRIMVEALGLQADAAPKTANHFTALAFMFAVETGMRTGEIMALTWEHAFADKRYVHVRKSKNGDARDVPLSTRAVELLGRLPREKGEPRCFRLSKSGIKMAWWEARNRAALKHPAVADLHFHDSRHEATTRLSRKLNVLALAKMIGHRDLKSLMIYYDETAAELAARLD
ncbi:Phage integrase family protein [Paraburkholderia tropica]